MSSVKFVQGRKKRGELRLPQLYFVAMDDWAEKLGDKAFIAWLKFYTWVDRKNSNDEIIPNSMSKIIKKLKVGNTTFYEQIIKPLWNYGLIDLKPIIINNTECMNIVVYEYPENKLENATKELVKLRDYDRDYKSKSREKILINKKKQRKNKVKDTPSQNRKGSEAFPEWERGFPEMGNINDPNLYNVSNDDDDILPKIVLDFVKENNILDKLSTLKEIYKEFKDKQGFSNDIFISKIRLTLIHGINFEKYLTTSIDNELDKNKRVKPKEVKKVNNKPVKKDILPDWIDKPEQNAVPSDPQADEEKRRRAEELLKKLPSYNE